MGPHMGGQPRDDGLTAADTATWARLNGVFWAAFLLFSWTTASVLSGAVIERIRSGAFWVLAVMAGSVTWVIAAAWGWSDAGWMVHILGYHDAYAGGVVHAVAGASALGILVHLGPRIGRFAADGSARTFPPHNPWLVAIGLFLIFTGFWGFYAACNVPIIDIDPEDGRLFFSATTIYLTPTTLSGMTVNLLMALAAGMLMAYFLSNGDPFWTFSGGLGGIIGASAGNDLYHPMQAALVAAIMVFCAFKLHYWVERRFKIDDAVGAIAVHGYCGALGVVATGFVLWGYPSSPAVDSAVITPWGQLLGAVIVFLDSRIRSCLRCGGRVEADGHATDSGRGGDRGAGSSHAPRRKEAVTRDSDCGARVSNRHRLERRGREWMSGLGTIDSWAGNPLEVGPDISLGRCGSGPLPHRPGLMGRLDGLADQERGRPVLAGSSEAQEAGRG